MKPHHSSQRHHHRTPGIILWCVLLLAFSASRSVCAQSFFGQNKVQYADFEWRVMSTEHFNIYYYEEERYVAEIAARSAEQSYTRLTRKFNHEIFSPIPLVIYSSPMYFAQTNTSSGLIPESTLGFTEFLKGRMVLPFTGSFADFDHVIRHELVHVFTLSKLARVQKNQRSIKQTLPPLWFIEGLAEHWSTDWDTQGDMLVRDMVISGQIIGIPEFWRIRGSFLMYKFGQSVCQFIEEEYGEDKITMIFENWWKSGKFGEVVRLTLGESLAEVSKKWEYSLKKKYFPLIADGDLPKSNARQLTSGGYAVKCAPVMFDDGDGMKEWIIYKADKLGYSSIYMMDGRGEKHENHTLVRGERSADFESLHLLLSGIDASHGKIAFSGKVSGSDALYIYDLRERKVTKRLRLDGIISIQSPRFSPSGEEVVLTGETRSGESDLYLINLDKETSRRLTNDIYQDLDPAFTSDGHMIVFSSDRGPWGDRGAKDIYLFDLATGDLKALTVTRFADRAPEPSDSGVFFTSDRDGANNIYFTDTHGNFSQVTHSVTGVFDPRVCPESNDLAYTGYQDFQFQIYRKRQPDSLTTVAQGEFFNQQYVSNQWRPATFSGESTPSTAKYENDYSFDLAQSALSYDPVFGTLGGLQVLMSDMLGDHVYYGFLSNSAQTKDDIFTSFNVGASYFNLKKRINWGVGALHLFNEYYNEVDGDYFERQVGGTVQLRYPLSRFNRIETTVFARWRDKDRFLFGSRDRDFLVSNFLSYVSDNSLWEPTGPIDGRRINLTLGVTTAVDEGRFNDVVAVADIRNYHRLGRGSAFATRIFGYTSGGDDPRRIYHGGSWSFRGFDRRQWYVPNIVFLSNELRFPLVNRLLVGLPIGNLGFSGIRGALFYDTGAAWENEFDRFLGSFGFGFRTGLGRLVAFRFDWTWTHDYRRINPGPDFDFFFGWNF